MDGSRIVDDVAIRMLLADGDRAASVDGHWTATSDIAPSRTTGQAESIIGGAVDWRRRRNDGQN